MRGGSKPKLYRFRGEWLSVSVIATILGVHENTVYNRRIGDRIAEGDELADPYREPPSHAVMIQIGGERLCMSDWARRKGISMQTIKSRIRRGHPPVAAVTMPVSFTGKRAQRYRRNAEIIRRMLSAIHTGGCTITFPNHPGTGAGRHLRDLQSEKMSG